MCSQFVTFLRVVVCGIIERNLKIISAILLALVLSLIIAIIVVTNKKQEIAYRLEEEEHSVCFTPGCVKKASSVLSNMDASIDPCDDFYQFACGGYINKTNIPDDQASVTAFTSVRDLVYQQIRNVLEEPPKEDELKPFVLTKQFYNSCTNTTAIEADGLTTIKAILENLGGWPLLEGTNWYGAKFDWKQTMYALRNIGFDTNYFLSVTVITDLMNSSQKVISLDQAVLELDREVLLQGREHNMVERYYEFMVDIAVLFGANRSLATVDLQKCLDFQKALANISLSPEQRSNKSLLYNPMTIAELQRAHPNINWKQYFKYLLDITDFEITDDEVIIVRVPKYLDDLQSLLNKTTKRVKANYIMWRAVSSSMNYYFTKDLRHRMLKYNKAISGVKQPLPRWKECLYQTLFRFWQPLRTLYDRKHFGKDSKKIASEILTDIQKEFTKLLGLTEWMDDDTAKSALEKAASLGVYIGTSETEENEELTKNYATLNFDSDNFLRTILAVSLFNNNNYFRNLRKPVKKQERGSDISMEYRIYVPGGIFQEVFFSNDRPNYMNYGGIGVLMGHLITHEFDNKGRQFDKDGDLTNWWTVDTEEAFKEKAECFVEQYENFTVPEISMNLNGRQTQDENIADNGGIKTAYLAYKAWVERNGPEPQLPGLNYTTQQMFWISVANVYCAKYRKQQLNLIILLAPFSPERYRIIASLSNSKYFAKDFNCPSGSNMNPERKCLIW